MLEQLRQVTDDGVKPSFDLISETDTSTLPFAEIMVAILIVAWLLVILTCFWTLFFWIPNESVEIDEQIQEIES